MTFKSVRATNDSSGKLVIVNDLFHICADNGMFGHPTRNAFALDRFLQVLKNIGVAMEIARLALNALSILDSVRKTPLAEESLLGKSGWAVSRSRKKKE